MKSERKEEGLERGRCEKGERGKEWEKKARVDP